MTIDNKHAYTQKEIDEIRAKAVTDSLVAKHELVIPQIFAKLEILEKGINNMPLTMTSCKADLKTEMREEAHRAFITDTELGAFEVKLETKMTKELAQINMKMSRSNWIMTGVISTATFFNYIIMHTGVIH